MIAFLCMAATSHAQLQSTLYNGVPSGQFSVQPTGSSQYAIQISLPPGNEEATPPLDIVYNSSGSNGLMGIGWSLNGLSAITRTGATVPEDGFRGGVNYDGNDRFAFNGQRLMNTAGNGATYFTPGASYYTEIQSWSKIVANGNAGSGPASFTVYLKNGSVVQYGSGNGSQVPAQGAAFSSGSLQGSISQWLVNKATTSAGNTITYGYTTSPRNIQGQPMNGSSKDGTAYPAYIAYGSNNGSANNRLVAFLYEPRLDTLFQFSGGSGSAVSARIKAIQTFVINGTDTTPVNTYVMQYDPSSPLNISRLISISILGSKGGSTEPLTFKWTNGATGLVPESTNWNGPSNNNGFVGDFNGDGKTDLLPIDGGMATTIYLASQGGFIEQTIDTPILVSQQNFVSDFNGDGLTDLFVLNGGTSQLYLCNGQGLTATPINIPPLLNLYGPVLTGDMNGDGMTDLLSYSGSTVYVYLATGTGFTQMSPFNNINLIYNQAYLADVNGDGQSDLFSVGLQQSGLYLSNFSQNGTFQPVINMPSIQYNSAQNTLLADYNSDGLTDIMIYSGSQYSIYYATGKGFSPAVPIPNMNLQNTQNWMGDFNGDGTMDLYTLIGSTATIYYNTTGKFIPQTGSSPALISGYTWSGDFNGDGIADLFSTSQPAIYFGGDQSSGTIPVSNQVPHLLTSINNSIGSTISCTYMPITNSSVYTPGSNSNNLLEGLRVQNRVNGVPLAPQQTAPYPYVQTQTAQYVTSAYSVTEGFGNTYPYTYQYAGSLQDIQAHGWLGFSSSTEVDGSAGNKTVNMYHQVYPLTGKRWQSGMYSLTDQLLQRSRYSYIIDTGSAGNNYQVFNIASRIDHFDYGNFTYTTGVDNSYDDFGNPKITVQLNDTSEKKNRVYTFNQYQNDVNTWHIGYKTGSQVAADSTKSSILQQFTYTYNTQNWLPQTSAIWFNSNNSWLTTQYGYDNWGNQIWCVNPAGDTSFTAYDAVYHSFPVSLTSPPNQWGARLVTYTTRDPGTGQTTSATDANGNVFQTKYDQFNRDSILTGPDSAGNTVVLSQLGYYRNNSKPGYSIIRILRGNWAGTVSDSSASTFDGMGRMIQRSWSGYDGQPTLQNITYNSNNKPLTISLPYFLKDPQQNSTLTYDAYQRLVSVIIPGPLVPITNTIAYAGKTVTVTLDSGSTQTAVSTRNFDYFNGRPKTIQRTDPAGLVTTWQYDLLGRDSIVTDPGGASTFYTWYSTNDMASSTNPAAGTTRIIRNYAAGSAYVITNMGDTIHYQQDALQRKLSVTSREGGQFYQYDIPTAQNGNGHLCKVVQASNKLNYAYGYDAYGRPTLSTTVMNNRIYAEQKTYNPDGSVATMQYPDNSMAAYSYYNNGYLKQISWKNSGSASFQPYVTYNQYDASGDQLQVSYGNGVQRNASFNPFGLLNSYIISGPQGQVLANKTYNWNSLFKVSSITDNLNNANSLNFQYTPNGRLFTASGTFGTEKYLYDGSGNLNQVNNVTFTTNNQYQVVAGNSDGAPFLSAGYDNNGNLTSRTLTKNQQTSNLQYRYNSFNQLVAVLSGKDTIQAYAYDYTGQRILLRNFSDQTNISYISPQFTEKRGPGQAAATRYINSPGQMIASVPQSGAATWYHQNFINTTFLTTNSNGTGIGNWEYHPYGTLYSAQGQDTSNNYLFSGMELDKTGLYYFNARYYDPLTSRFITADNQLGSGKLQTDSYNRYAYALNDPVKNYDPTGHAITEDILLGVMNIVAGVATDEASDVLILATDADVDEAKNIVGADFLKGMSGRDANTISSEKSFRIFQAKRDVRYFTMDERFDFDATKPSFKRLQVIDEDGKVKTIEESVRGFDPYNNEILVNRGQSDLASEINTRDELLAAPNTRTKWAISDNDIITTMNSSKDVEFKFTLTYENYELRIGTTDISHAAIEGNGNFLYTAGRVTLKNGEVGNRVLEVTNVSGHYRPSLESNYMADPIWRCLKQNGLQFDSIVYRARGF